MSRLPRLDNDLDLTLVIAHTGVRRESRDRRHVLDPSEVAVSEGMTLLAGTSVSSNAVNGIKKVKSVIIRISYIVPMCIQFGQVKIM